MTLPQLTQRRALLKAYVLSCMEQSPEDLHGARDAIVDIEVIDARIGERASLPCKTPAHLKLGQTIRDMGGNALGYTECVCAECKRAQAMLRAGLCYSYPVMPV